MKRSWPVLALATLAACGGGPADPGSTGPAGSGESAEPAAALAAGETLSLACQACHSLQPGAPHLVGPNLSGVFGRRAGTAAGYGNYSDALLNADFVWTPVLLDRWLENPADFLPGTTMAFTGYRAAEDRAALLAYLVAATAVDRDAADRDAAD